MRGYFGIACYAPKNRINIGGIWRSAHVFGASWIATIGARYRRQAADTTKAWKHVPLWEFLTVEEFWEKIPRECRLVVVERREKSVPLTSFVHPERAVYVFGPEEGSVPRQLCEKALAVVEIPTAHCLNLATTAGIVMYDRQTKAT